MNSYLDCKGPVAKGDRVHLTAYDGIVKVEATLATQFTVLHGDRTLFFFYADERDTWTRVKTSAK